MKTDLASSWETARRGFPRVLFFVVAFFIVGISPARGANSAGSPIVRAAAFLDASNRGSFVVNYLHMGATYAGQKCLELAPVKDGLGQQIPGEFALVYRYYWNDGDNTDVAFFFDLRGHFESLRVMRTTAISQQPFAASTEVIQLIGNSLIATFRKNMSVNDQEELHRLVGNADIKGLLELALRFQQSFAH